MFTIWCASVASNKHYTHTYICHIILHNGPGDVPKFASFHGESRPRLIFFVCFSQKKRTVQFQCTRQAGTARLTSRNSKAKSTNRWFDGNRRVHTPNDILIGSSVFAQLNQQTHRPRYIGSNRPHRWTPCVQCDLIRGGSMGGSPAVGEGGRKIFYNVSENKPSDRKLSLIPFVSSVYYVE